MNDELLILDSDGVRTVTLNRPEKRNALSPELIAALHGALTDAAADETVRVVVLTGAGKAFCAGADLAYLQRISENTPIENERDSTALMEMIYALRTFPKPTLAKINGHALAGGCGLALACDIAVASEAARLGFTEVRIGFVPAIVMKIAVEKMGAARARELLLRGNQVHAAEAVQIGMVHYAVPPDELDAKTAEITGELARLCSPQSHAQTKRLLDEIDGMGLREALEHSALANALSRTGGDFRKGIGAFLDKKTPEW